MTVHEKLDKIIENGISGNMIIPLFVAKQFYENETSDLTLDVENYNNLDIQNISINAAYTQFYINDVLCAENQTSIDNFHFDVSGLYTVTLRAKNTRNSGTTTLTNIVLSK